jgi:hypothetical protein
MESKPKEKNNHPTQPHWREMNRKQRRETMRKIQSEDLSLELVHRDAAGIVKFNLARPGWWKPLNLPSGVGLLSFSGQRPLP